MYVILAGKNFGTWVMSRRDGRLTADFLPIHRPEWYKNAIEESEDLGINLEVMIQNCVKLSNTCGETTNDSVSVLHVASQAAPMTQRTPSMAARMASTSAPAFLPSEPLPAKWLAAERR